MASNDYSDDNSNEWQTVSKKNKIIHTSDTERYDTKSNTYGNSGNHSNVCINCGKRGHLYATCNQPVTSIGIICYRNKVVPSIIKSALRIEREYLFIRRRDSLGYVDFIRGKYDTRQRVYLQNIIDEMTIDEKYKIITTDFDTLWCDFWGKNSKCHYRSEEDVSRRKFNELKAGVYNNNERYTLKMLVKESKTKWTEPEWGFPKGRRNQNERDIDTALREFEEETGIKSEHIELFENVIPYEEIFMGSNFKSYNHRYFVAHMRNNKNVDTSQYGRVEVSKVQWLSLTDAKNHIRCYNREKFDILKRVDNVLNTFYSFQV